MQPRFAILLLVASTFCSTLSPNCPVGGAASSCLAEDQHFLIRVRVSSSDNALKKQVEDSLWVGLKSMSGDGVVLETDFDFAADHIELDIIADPVKDYSDAVAISDCLYEAREDSRQSGASTPSRIPVMMSHGLATCSRKKLPEESERLGTKLVEILAPDLALKKHKRLFGH